MDGPRLDDILLFPSKEKRDIKYATVIIAICSLLISYGVAQERPPVIPDSGPEKQLVAPDNMALANYKADYWRARASVAYNWDLSDEQTLFVDKLVEFATPERFLPGRHHDALVTSLLLYISGLDFFTKAELNELMMARREGASLQGECQCYSGIGGLPGENCGGNNICQECSSACDTYQCGTHGLHTCSGLCHPPGVPIQECNEQK